MKIPPSLLTTLTLTLTITIINIRTTNAFYGRTEQGNFYSGNHAKADIAAEKRAIRLADAKFRTTAQNDVLNLVNGHIHDEYVKLAVRGSAYLADGVTVIIGNESFGASHDDPRVPVGFGDPLAKRNMDLIVGDPTSSAVTDAVETVPIETFESGWILMDSIGRLYDGDMTSPDAFNSLLNANSVKLVRIVCESCNPLHREVYYRRITTIPADFNLFDVIRKDWKSASNTLNVDFSLFSSYENALSGQNAWQYCGGFDVEGQGFPGTCGASTASQDQWINMEVKNGQPDVAIFVQDATAPADVFHWADWARELEVFHINSPTEAKEKGLCWHLPLSDSRRKCWLACKHSERTNDLGVLKLCLNMRHKGQVWKTKTLADDSEVMDGIEVDHKIKDNHALGFDDDLPNLGTY